MNYQQQAAKQAFDLISYPNWVLIDTETTGLGREAQICEIAVLHPSGNCLLDTRIKPTIPIEPEASQIHGIKDEDVNDAPTFDQVLLRVMNAVGTLNVVFYSAEFEMRLIRQSLRPYGIQLAFPNSDRRQCRIFTNGGSIICAMLMYSKWCGEWDESKGDWKWQKLPGAMHNALDDCRAVLEVIRTMAASYQMLEPVPAEDEGDRHA